MKTRKRQKSIEEISEDEEDGKKRKGKRGRGKQNKKQEVRGFFSVSLYVDAQKLTLSNCTKSIAF